MGDCEVGLSLGGVASRDSPFDDVVVEDEKKEGDVSRFGMKCEGRDNEGRALDSLFRASVPLEDDRRCLAVANTLVMADLWADVDGGATTISLGPVFHGVGNLSRGSCAGCGGGIVAVGGR